jgi:two-component system, sensor histidine kinase and response regulator
VIAEVVDSGESVLPRLRVAVEAGCPYDLVLVDALMPGKDGFTVIDEINSDPTLNSTTLLMLSSADRSAFTERVKALHVDGYLQKPVARRELFDVMCRACFGPDGKKAEPGTRAIVPTPLRVLVVEDLPANQKFVQAILQKRGHSVSLANNGREALEKMYGMVFDIVLMDVQMPTLDGYQATMAIRQLEDPIAANTAIIAMTAHAMRGDAQKCLEAGMNDYISKPLDSTRLVQLVERWGRTRATPLAAGNPAQPSASRDPDSDVSDVSDVAPTPVKVADFESALARLDGNQRLLADMIGFFREDVPELLNSLDAGIAEGDAPRVKRAAHSIKGLAASFDAERVTSQALQIEKLAEIPRLQEIPPLLPNLRQAISELETAFTQFEAT